MGLGKSQAGDGLIIAPLFVQELPLQQIPPGVLLILGGGQQGSGPLPVSIMQSGLSPKEQFFIQGRKLGSDLAQM